MNIAVIPARGGSKRIPRKNIKLFHGIPIIAYAINSAWESGVFDEVIVSTEDYEIAEIAMHFGATIPWMRTKELSDDYATTLSVMQDAVFKLKADTAAMENVCCIYPATPLLKPGYITQGLQKLKNEEWKYVFSGQKANQSPQRLFSLSASKGVELLFPKYNDTRTQDLDDFFYDAGQFYWGQVSSWENGIPIFSSNSTIVEIPRNLAVDIDTVEDWQYAESLFEKNKKNPNPAIVPSTSEIF
jgi:pseudaminic acid cytidylyltransferase